jgi:hypothetical protein
MWVIEPHFYMGISFPGPASACLKKLLMSPMEAIKGAQGEYAPLGSSFFIVEMQHLAERLEKRNTVLYECAAELLSKPPIP